MAWQGDNLRFREHRKLISGRMSGRNRPEQLDGGADAGPTTTSSTVGLDDIDMMDVDEEGAALAAAAAKRAAVAAAVPPLRGWAEEVEAEEERKGLEMEWWDEAFLTKETRDQKVKGSRDHCAFFFSGGVLDRWVVLVWFRAFS